MKIKKIKKFFEKATFRRGSRFGGAGVLGAGAAYLPRVYGLQNTA
jgi:hypothetical protein